MDAAMDVDGDEPLSADAVQQVLADLTAHRHGTGRGWAASDGMGAAMQFTGASGQQTLLVIDTNVLLSSLAFLDALVTRLAELDDPPCALLLPRVVIGELDGLKRSRRITSAPNAPPTGPAAAPRSGVEISVLARKATHWLEKIFRRRGRALYGQAPGEVSGLPVQSNDDMILDAALHWTMRGTRAVLFSEDANLRVKSLAAGVECIKPDPSMPVVALLAHLGVVDASPAQPSTRPAPVGVATEPAPMDADETTAIPTSEPTTKRELFVLIDDIAGGVIGPHLARLLGVDHPPRGGREVLTMLAFHWSVAAAQLDEQPPAAAWGAASSRWATVDSPGKAASRIAQCRSHVFALCESLEPSQDVRTWTRLRFEALIQLLRDTVAVLCADDAAALGHVQSLSTHLDYVFDV